MEFGNRLRKLRIEKGLSQKEVALEISVSVNAISQYETDKRFPDQDVLIKLCKFYRISADYLLGLTDYRRSPNTSKEIMSGVINSQQHEAIEKIIEMLIEKEK